MECRVAMVICDVHVEVLRGQEFFQRHGVATGTRHVQRRNAVDIFCVHVEIAAVDEQLYSFAARVSGRDSRRPIVFFPSVAREIRSVVPNIRQITTGEVEWSELLLCGIGIWVCGG